MKEIEIFNARLRFWLGLGLMLFALGNATASEKSAPKTPPNPKPPVVTVQEWQTQAQTQVQFQHQTQEQGNEQTTDVNSQANSTSGGNTQSTTYQSPRNVASALAGTSNNTSPCTRSVGLGGQGAGFGASLGLPFADGECNLRETALGLAAIGDRSTAKEALCATRAARRAKLEGCNNAPQVIAQGAEITNEQLAARTDRLTAEVERLRQENAALQAERDRRLREALRK
jgi:hypothetical protein